ncbi:MAG: NAD-dependent epimerase/dehydratase family protein [Planctomycetes bacterium]|nr:NAD-dependent epimerase/dehydratase family protein [Planctomycetota bacterium]
MPANAASEIATATPTDSAEGTDSDPVPTVEVRPRGVHGGARSAAILVTGATGEVGHGLITALHSAGCNGIVALDVRKIDAPLRSLCMETYVGDICDNALLGRLLAMYEITEIYHLAALLSTRAEFTPETAHAVNVGGTINLLQLAAEQARSHGHRVKFIFPSSIAAHGLPDLDTKATAGRVSEDAYCKPTTMYGCNKLYCENLGRYYARHYRQLAQDQTSGAVDFRCLRYPGLISADTLPAGGTSDYAPEMIHAAASGKPYACFVRGETRIPFMTMPEAIDATLRLAAADETGLSRCVYNVSSFSASAGAIAEIVRGFFPGAQITFEPDEKRQAIVDTWPADVDDTAARNDWGHTPKYTLEQAFEEYLVPTIRARYA